MKTARNFILFYITNSNGEKIKKRWRKIKKSENSKDMFISLLDTLEETVDGHATLHTVKISYRIPKSYNPYLTQEMTTLIDKTTLLVLPMQNILAVRHKKTFQAFTTILASIG